MTLGDQIARVRYLGRLTSSSVSDSQITDALNTGLRQFAIKAHGVPLHTYVSLLPRFDIQTNYGLRIVTNAASASLAVSSVTLASATGAAVAGKLQTAIKVTWASATVSWAAWRFAITIPGATSIQVTGPTLQTRVDAGPILFGVTGTKAASVWTGGFPEACTMEAALPSGFISDDAVEWDITTLARAPFDLFLRPQYSGYPEWYTVRNKRLRLLPVPETQKYLKVTYTGVPTVYATATSTSTTCTLDTEYHMAPVYYAVSELAEGTPDPTLANRFLQRFSDMTRDYLVQKSNQSPKGADQMSQGKPNLAFKVGTLQDI